jgi:hypothetical protein
VLEDPAARANERLVVGAKTDAAQRGIALHGAVDIAVRSLVVRLPGAVRPLRFQKRRDEILLARMPVSQEVHGEQPLGLHAVVRFEHADPEAFRRLVAIEPADRLGDCGVNALGRAVQCAGRGNEHNHRR